MSDNTNGTTHVPFEMFFWSGAKPLGSPSITTPPELDPPPDPFQGMGDFDIHPLAAENFALREAERVWRERAIKAELSLTLIAAWLPAKKTPAKELQKLVQMVRSEVEERLAWLR